MERPGAFTAEFSKCCSTERTPLLLNMFNESLVKGELPCTLSKALIAPVLEKEKDPAYCKNYRPISIISVDTKILSSVLANMLEKLLTSLVHEDQVGFI